MFTTKRTPVRKAWDAVRSAHDETYKAAIQLIHGETCADADEIKAILHDTILLLSAVIILAQACHEQLGIAGKEDCFALIHKLSSAEENIQEFISKVGKD